MATERRRFMPPASQRHRFLSDHQRSILQKWRSSLLIRQLASMRTIDLELTRKRSLDILRMTKRRAKGAFAPENVPTGSSITCSRFTWSYYHVVSGLHLSWFGLYLSIQAKNSSHKLRVTLTKNVFSSLHASLIKADILKRIC